MANSNSTDPIIPSPATSLPSSTSPTSDRSLPDSSSSSFSRDQIENIPPILPIPPISSSSRSAPTSKELEAILHSSNPRPPVSKNEVSDEKCWTRCKQTNARRALGRDATCTSLCYINMRNHINALLPVAGHPGTFLAAMDKPSVAKPFTTTTKDVDPEAPIVPAYHWKGLDGRYLYYASGRDLVSAHMSEMGGENWKGIEALEARCEAARLDREEKAPKSRAERIQQLGVRRSLGMSDEDSYEKLISLSEAYSSNLQAFHRHCLRIYSPVFKNIARLPETFKDGTQLNMLNTIWTKLSDGSAYTLASRMVTSTIDVAKQLQQRRSGGDSSSSSTGGGLGGLGGGSGTPAL